MQTNENLRFLIIGNYTPLLLMFRGPLMRTLIANGHEVHAIAPLNEHNTSEQERLSGLLQDMGVKFHPIDLSRTGIDPVHDLTFARAVRRKFKELKPDRIMAYSIKPIIYCGLAARSLKHPHYYPLFSGLGYTFSDNKGLKNRLVRTIASGLLKASIKKARAIIFQNPDDQALIRENGLIGNAQPSFVVNGSGVDMQHYTAHLHDAPPKAPSFLMVGRVLIDKGIREYAQAAAILKAKYPDCRFVHVGEDDRVSLNSPDTAEYDSWTAVDFIGRDEDVRPHLKDCDIFVLPSFYREGVPRSILEAMATGRAIITTDRPGCRETVSDGENGFFVPAKDAKALAKAMERFITDPQLCITMGKASYKTAKQKYDVDLVNAELYKIMDMVE